MDFTRFNKRIAISVLVLGLSAGGASAAPILSGNPVTVPINATVLNTIAVTINNNLSFGTVAAFGKVATQAVAHVTAAAPAVLVDDNGGGVSTVARILKDTALPPAAASITLQGFNSTVIYVSYGAVVNMTNGLGQSFNLVHLQDNLDAPDTGVCPCVQGNWGLGAQGDPGPVTNQGHALTTAGGALAFHIGGWFSTVTGAALVYPAANPYVGSFDVTLSY